MTSPPLTCRGRWLRTAAVFDEIWRSDEPGPPSPALLRALQCRRPPIDLFTFTPTLPDISRPFPYACTAEPVAAIELTDFQSWWNTLPHATQTNVRKAARCGVSVRLVPFDATLVGQIQRIFDETPIRHHRRFRHFGADAATLETSLGTYRERSVFLGAFCENELIGFLKLVVVGQTGRIMHLLALERHREKRTVHALLAAAVAQCAQRSLRYLVYDLYLYHGAPDSLTEFKRRNGFRPIAVPRYFVPLTWRGKLALALGLHRGVAAVVPPFVFAAFRSLRAGWYRAAARRAEGPAYRSSHFRST